LSQVIKVDHDASNACLCGGLGSHGAADASDSSLDGANDFSFNLAWQGTGISDSDADRRAPQARVDAALEPNECARSYCHGRENSRDGDSWTVNDSVEEAHGVPGVGQRSDLHQH